MESQYLGCYIDDTTRDIAPTWTNVVDIASCQVSCTGFAFFSLQNGYACFCGNKYATKPIYAKVADTECGGIVGKSMGAVDRNAVFFLIYFQLLIARYIVIKIIMALLTLMQLMNQLLLHQLLHHF